MLVWLLVDVLGRQVGHLDLNHQSIFKIKCLNWPIGILIQHNFKQLSISVSKSKDGQHFMLFGNK